MRKRFLAVTMILASIFVFSLGVSAADGENAEALPPAASAVVTLSLQDGADIVLPPMMVQVTGDVSDVFEYADTIPYTDGVSALDVLIVAHGIAYGQDFLDNPGNYLVISPEGYVTKIYGIDSWGFCYMINGEGGHTDQPSSWGGGFESLLVNQAAVQGGDRVDFALGVDPTYNDNAPWFMQDGKRVDIVRAKVGAEIPLQLQSYNFMMYSAYGTEAITKEHLTPVANVKTTNVSMDQDGKITHEVIEDGETDAEGKVTLLGEAAGQYLVSAQVTDKEKGFYCFYPMLMLNVVDPVDPAAMTDLKAGAWYQKDVSAVLAEGYMNGMNASTFAPNDQLTREQFVTILYRAANEPFTPFEPPFKDLTSDWSFDAICWAYETGVVNGMTETTFAPKEKITREQMAAIMARYADAFGIELATDKGSASFSDADKISNYAKESVDRLVKAGILKGMEDGTFAPKGSATRAQAATVLCRFLGLN